jgi:hypothetical protein
MTKYKPNTDLDPAWIVDIDGTMTTGPFKRTPFQWNKVGNDLPNYPVIDVVNALYWESNDIVFVSGRDEVCRSDTQQWLKSHWGYDKGYYLLMRPHGDRRPDEVVKAEIFDLWVAPRFHVKGVIDDRAKVVKMWRDKGLTCLQVAEGAF